MSNIDDDQSQADDALPSHSARRDLIVCFALFVMALVVYVKTLCPTIFTDDCGEIATAVVTGGVIHPPGYPLYTLIGTMLVKLIHFGEPAWRLGFLSAIPAAAAVALSYKLARRIGVGMTWSISAALAFAFSIALWQQATKVETYGLNAFFIVLLFNLGIRYSLSGSRRDLIVVALCAGLSLTNHLTAVCALAGVLWIALPALRRDPKPAAAIALAIVFGLLPLSLYVTVWMAAVTHPGGEVWGDPSNAHRFWLHVTGARYKLYAFSLGFLGMMQRDFVDLPGTLWRNLGWYLVGAVPGAARGLWVPQTRRMTQGLLVSVTLYIIETSAYGILNIFEYYTPLIMLLCILSGIGMDAIVVGLMKKFNAPRRQLKTLQVGICVLVGACALLMHWSYCDRSSATFMRNFALNTLDNLPANSILFAYGDNRVFPIWYVQDVLHVRQDVVVIPWEMMPTLATAEGRQEMGWELKKLVVQHPNLIDSEVILRNSDSNQNYIPNEGTTWDIAARALSAHRPLFITDVRTTDIRRRPDGMLVMTALHPDCTLVESGLVDQVVPVRQFPNLPTRVARSLQIERDTQIDFASPNLMQDEPDGQFTNMQYAAMLARNADMLARAGNPRGAYSRLVLACQLYSTPQYIASLQALPAALRKTASAVRQIDDNQEADADPTNGRTDYVLFDGEEPEPQPTALTRSTR